MPLAIGISFATPFIGSGVGGIPGGGGHVDRWLWETGIYMQWETGIYIPTE